MRIFIACSSSTELAEKYLNLATSVCQKITNNNTLVFGTYSKSMMGRCFQAFKNNNIMAVSLKEYQEDFKNMPLLNITLVDNVFDRLKFIYNNSDLFLILPGGTGTYSELLGIIEQFKTNKQNKKLIIYNYEGFYDKLIDFIKDKQKEKFVHEEDLNNMIIIDNLKELEENVYERN